MQIRNPQEYTMNEAASSEVVKSSSPVLLHEVASRHGYRCDYKFEFEFLGSRRPENIYRDGLYTFASTQSILYLLALTTSTRQYVMKRQLFRLYTAAFFWLPAATYCFTLSSMVRLSPSSSHTTTAKALSRRPQPDPPTTRRRRVSNIISSSRLGARISRNNNNNDDDNNNNLPPSTCWNPQLRRVMGSIALLGVLETGFLTYQKLTGGDMISTICGLQQGDCGSVLSGPYAVLPGTDNIPLAAVGLLAYSAVAVLALQPLLLTSAEDPNEENNRVLLAALTTGMGVFSIFLLTLLFGVLHQNCTFCVASAVFSIVLAKLSWLSALVPNHKTKEAVVKSLYTSAAALMAAIVIFVAAESPSNAAAAVANDSWFQASDASSSTTMVINDASSERSNTAPSPPLVTTTSSPRALTLATKLQSLNAHFYGAYWCSHCLDQKQTLGQAAMSKIPYVECSKEGFQSQSKLCSEKKIPGYPTWEIQGKLYPGEQSLEELEELVTTILAEPDVKQ
jgi:uncharacterized membrane protein